MFLEIIILLKSRAVAGIVFAVIGEQFPACVIQKCAAFLIKIHLHEMEAADQDIRTEPVHDIEDSFMRTAADHDAFSVVRQNKVLLVTEIFRYEFSVFLHLKTERNDLVFWRTVVA